MLEAASFSLRALLDFRPRVRGGDGTEISSESEASTELLDGTESVKPAEAEGTGPEARNSFAATGPGGVKSGGLSSAEARSFLAATDSGGVESGGLSPTGGFPLTAAVSGSWASSSFNASKLFLFSRVASAE
jgi:hypothetical protein